MIYVETYDHIEGNIKNDRQYRGKCIYESKYLKKSHQIIECIKEEIETFIEQDILIEMKCETYGCEEGVLD